MNREQAKDNLVGCYTTVPTMFHDDNLDLNLDGMKRHVEFLLDGGLRQGSGTLLAGGGAGDFSTLSIEERIQVARTVVTAADGQIPVVMGAQTTNTRELIQLAEAAADVGAEYIQISPPFYFNHTSDDFFEYVSAAANAVDIGIIIYNTYWTSRGVTTSMIEQLCEIPQFVGLKWSSPDGVFLDFESAIAQYSDRLSIIDNQLKFVTSHILGARSIELHICNHWPQWGVELWQMLENKQYSEVQWRILQVVQPFMKLWREMEQYTSGDGYLDKLCMELVGMDSSRCRPPTRDVRDKFRDQTRQMLIDCGTPGVN